MIMIHTPQEKGCNVKFKYCGNLVFIDLDRSNNQSPLDESGSEGRKKGHRFGTSNFSNCPIECSCRDVKCRGPTAVPLGRRSRPSFAGCSDELFLDFERELADLLGHPDG